MKSNHPDKQKVRDWMQERHKTQKEPRKPVPTPEQIRRELGWELTIQPQVPKDNRSST